LTLLSAAKQPDQSKEVTGLGLGRLVFDPSENIGPECREMSRLTRDDRALQTTLFVIVPLVKLGQYIYTSSGVDPRSG
jgi:hypothetical protein